MGSSTASALELLAHHEAAHAALAYRFGLRLYAVRINVASDNGTTTLAAGEQPTALQHALILLAGGRAEHVLDPGCLSQRISAAKDESDLMTLVSERLEQRLIRRPIEYVDRLAERLDSRLAACCERLVREEWPAIQRLAKRLCEQHELTGAEAEAVLRP